MSDLSQKRKLEIRDEWLELRASRVAKPKRLKVLAEKHGVTQKTIKEVTYEFNVWTLGEKLDETWEQKQSRWGQEHLELEAEGERQAERFVRCLKVGCAVVPVLVIAYLIYAFSIDYGDPFREVIDGVECNKLNQCRETPWYRR